MADNGNFVDITDEFMYNYTSITNKFVACINPFRYRSYYYDFETGIYYLNSRYYDPEIGRFINADDVSTLDITKITLNGLNLYAYCLNNPVNHVDENGYFLGFLLAMLLGAVIGALVGAVVYTGSVIVKGIMTGIWEWNWAEFFGSVVGGFIGGALSVLPISNLITAFVTGFFTELLTDAFSSAIYGTEFNFKNSIINAGISGALSAVFAGLMGNVFKVERINAGRGSWSAVSKQVFTKFRHDVIKNISWKTFGKMFGLSLYESTIDIFHKAFA